MDLPDAKALALVLEETAPCFIEEKTGHRDMLTYFR